MLDQRLVRVASNVVEEGLARLAGRRKERAVLKTHAVKESEIERRWYIVDAAGQPLGRLATRVATVLKGKHKPMYTTHMDVGDYVVVVNAEKIYLSGQKMTQKVYKHHSGHPGGLKIEPVRHVLETFPTRVVERAVKGMLPKNALGNKMLKKLKIYAGPTHPHAAQQVQPFPPALVREPRATASIVQIQEDDFVADR